MIKITRTQPYDGDSNLRPLGNPDVGGSLQLGGAIARAGQDLSNQGAKFIEEANASFNDAIYNRAYSSAITDFNDQYNARLNARTDKDGNPTFGTLPEDVRKLGDTVSQKYSMSILDLKSRQKFDQEFNQFKTSRLISAHSEARNQQIDFSTTELNTSINKLVTQAVTGDPAEADHLLGSVYGMLNDSLSSGLLSPNQAAKIRENARSSIRLSTWQKAIESNPELAKATLESTEFDKLDMGYDDYQKLLKYSEAVIKDNKSQASKLEIEQNKIVREQQNLNSKGMSLGILKGEVLESDIVAAEQNKSISQLHAIELRKQLFNKQEKDISTNKSSAIIDAALQNGSVITGVSSSDISNHFNNRVALQKDQNGNPPPLMEQAHIASQYKSAVKPMQQQLSALALAGEPSKAVEAADAYSFLVESDSRALEGMSKDDQAVLQLMSTLRNSTNMSPNDLVKFARESVNNKDDSIRKARSTAFSKADQYNSSNIKETLSDYFDIDEDSVSDETANTFRSLLQEAYTKTGNEEAALNLVKTWTKNDYGVTEFAGNEGENYVYMPPEKVYEGTNPSVLRQDLEESLASLGFQGVEATLSYDSSSTFRNPQWFVTTKDSNGNEQLLLDNQGYPIRWGYNDAPEDPSSFNGITPEQVIKGVKQVGEKLTGIAEGINMGLGDISKKYESGRLGAGTISSGKGDPGGKSYGSYQLASKTGTLSAFIEGSRFKKELSKYRQGTPEFDNTWKRLASEHPSEFAADQHDFISRTHFTPLRSAADTLGLPDTEAVNEALFSMSVQHGKAASIVKKAAASINLDNASEEDVVKALYKARATYVSGLKMPVKTKEAVLDRYSKEEQDVLKLVNGAN